MVEGLAMSFPKIPEEVVVSCAMAAKLGMGIENPKGELLEVKVNEVWNVSFKW